MSRTINLLPDPVIDTQKSFTKVFQGVVVGLIGIILFGLFNLVLFFLSLQVTNALNDAEAQATALEQEIEGFSDIEDKLRVVQGRLLDFQRIRKTDGNYQDIWRQLFAAKTDDMLFTELTYRSQTNIILSANTVSLKNAVTFLLALRETDTLSEFVVTEINYNRFTKRYFFETRIILSK